MKKRIFPVILSGGNGTRLWPSSRASYPKQFIPFLNRYSLLQNTLLRSTRLKNAAPPLIICNQDHRFIVQGQCAEIGIAPAAIYLEPLGKNTAPAIALAAFHLAAHQPDALMLVLPADHRVDDQVAFEKTVSAASLAAQEGSLVTFGITPTHAETGYGYIHIGEKKSTTAAIDYYRIRHFHEKPSEEDAQHYLRQGDYLWNSGMFVFSAQVYLKELKKYQPEMYQQVKKSWQRRQEEMGFTRPEYRAFCACPANSIDYGVMQSTRKAVVIPADFQWSDIGSWASLWDTSCQDAQRNVFIGHAAAVDTSNSYIRAEKRFVSVVGLNNVVVVETADAVLVMNKDHAQSLKNVIQASGQADIQEYIEHSKIYRPWGWYEKIDAGTGFKVKRIIVKSGKKLSLQKHLHRTEHWVVVKGRAKVTIDGEKMILKKNQSVSIPVGKKHRLENIGQTDLYMIEVQSGHYLEEDDIIRYSDEYGR